MEGTIIEAEHLSCKLGYRYLLQDVTWRVESGQRWVVFGMNGSGKTTLLSIIAAYQQFTSGSLKLFGEPLTAEQLLKCRKRIGWVSSSFFDKYYSREAVMDIVLSGQYGTLGLNGYVPVKARHLAMTLLEELHLGDKAGHAFDMLSKGQRQNVLIARALISQPDVLVLDEPCTGLDVYNRQYLFQTLDDLAQEKQLTITYVTHCAEEIRPLFEQCLFLKNGRVFAQGRTKDLFQPETLSALLDQRVEINAPPGQAMQLKVAGVSSRMAQFLAADQRKGDADQ